MTAVPKREERMGQRQKFSTTEEIQYPHADLRNPSRVKKSFKEKHLKISRGGKRQTAFRRTDPQLISRQEWKAEDS